MTELLGPPAWVQIGIPMYGQCTLGSHNSPGSAGCSQNRRVGRAAVHLTLVQCIPDPDLHYVNIFARILLLE